MLQRLIVSSLALAGIVLALEACTKDANITQTAPVCGRGEYSCNGDTLQRCRDDGSGFDGLQICDPGGCVQGKTECQKPPGQTVKPLGPSDWVSCPASSPNRTDGDMPCKPVTVNLTVSAKPVRIVIDPYEVTGAEYLRFWKAVDEGKTLPGLPAACAFKEGVGHTPERAGWPSITETEAKTPVRGVDWCDAWAYCRWAGKRLCGRPGGGPAPYAFTPNDLSAAEGKRTDNEWSIACNGGGVRQWSFDDQWDELACNTQLRNQPAREPGPVGAFPRCKTPEGVYDMNGNSPELIDMCEANTGRDDLCIIGGGSSGTWGATADCGLFLARRGTRNVPSFRCCAD
jgi:hypothetical protein